MAFSFSDQDTDTAFSFTESNPLPVPTEAAIDARVEKTNYALGDKSPGTEALKQTIFAGGEKELRQTVAAQEDQKYRDTRDAAVKQVIDNFGSELTPEQAKKLQTLAQTEYNNDPSSVLEKAYAEKFVNDILSSGRVNPDAAPKAPDAAASVLARREFFQTGLENIQSEWGQQGWLTTAKDYAVGMIPFLPWWRQAQALSERPTHLSNILQGKTMRDNIEYLWSLPFEDAKTQYNKAIDYLKNSGNLLDAMTFAQAMVSFGTSDEALANSMSVADIATTGLPALKMAAKFARGMKATAEAPSIFEEAIKATDTPEPLQITQEKRLLLTYEGSNKFTTQPDLFGEQPVQGSFRFMANTPDQVAPTLESKLPPGKMRATHITDFADYGQYELPVGRSVRENGLFRDELGRIRRSSNAYKQGEFPFETPEHQGSLDLGPPKPPEPAKPTDTPKPPTPPSEPEEQVKRSLADAIKATEGDPVPDPPTVIAASGNTEQGGYLNALKRILNPLGLGNKEVAKEVPTFANPDGFLKDSKVISRARAQLLKPQLEDAGTKLTQNFWQLARVSRITGEQLSVARTEAEAALRKEYGKRLGDAIMDVTYRPAEMHPANVETVSLKVGMPDANLFPTKEKAALFREQYGLGEKEALIHPQGDGYFLEIPKHIDETSDMVRDVTISPKNATNNGVVNQLLNRLRTTEDLLGMFQRDNRQIAVHTPQSLRKVIRDYIAENIESLPKQSRRALNDILRENRDMPSKFNPAERGRWYDSAGEFEQAYSQRFHRMPTEQEVLAYDAFKRLSDFDWLTRNVAVYRDKARQGIETFRYAFEGNKTPWFEGKIHDKMPWSIGNKADQDAGVWLYDSGKQQGRFFYKFNMTPEERAYVDHLTTNEGYRVVQVFDPKKHPLQGIAKAASGGDLEEQVNYVITNAWEKSPLSWKQVDYRPGGHVVYAHRWYVAQPQIKAGRLGKHTYFGDNNILNVRTEAEARKWAERLDYARKLYKMGNRDELYNYIDTQLPHTRDQFFDLFRRSDSPLSLDHPVTFKEAGKNTIGTDAPLKAEYKNIIDGTRNVHDLSNFMDKAYLMDRDNILNGVNEKTMQLVAAEQLDPYVALNRAVGQSIRNLWMNDYKIGAVEAWVKEFEHVMQPSDAALLKHPLFFLYNPQWKNVSSAAQADLAAAKAAQRAIVNFIGTKTELGSALDSLKMKALNSVYNIAGQGKVLDIALATTSDPVHFLRGVAFHSKLGMFNPVQFFVQAQSMMHSIAVAGPKHGIPGFAAAPMLRWLGHNPAQLDTVAGVAEKLGWTRAQFKEMYATFQKTGLYEVAGEAALRDDAFDPHLFRTSIGKYILDAGPMFFNEGERMTRLTAFATAFREFRAANKSVAIGNREIGAILRRADDLSVNMTRASNAAWQTGVWSIPFQFYAYNARVMEQLLGGRLTGLEKARMMGVYSLLYGIPIGAGAAVGGVWPVYDSIKQEALLRGINLNDGWAKVATEGMMAQLTSWATGKDYNIPQRYGPGNQQAVRDLLSGDKKFADALFGASGTIVDDMVAATYPFAHNLAGVFIDNGAYPLKSSDWMTLFRNISTFDTAAKAWGAMAYGQWYTKTGTDVAQADTMDAAMSVLGLSPRSVSDTFLWQHALYGQKDAQNQYKKWAMEQIRRGLQEGANGNYDSMRDYFTRARHAVEAGQFNFAQKSALWQQSFSQYQTLSDKVKWDAYKQASPGVMSDILHNFIQKKQ